MAANSSATTSSTSICTRWRICCSTTSTPGSRRACSRPPRWASTTPSDGSTSRPGVERWRTRTRYCRGSLSPTTSTRASGRRTWSSFAFSSSTTRRTRRGSGGCTTRWARRRTTSTDIDSPPSTIGCANRREIHLHLARSCGEDARHAHVPGHRRGGLLRRHPPAAPARFGRFRGQRRSAARPDQAREADARPGRHPRCRGARLAGAGAEARRRLPLRGDPRPRRHRREVPLELQRGRHPRGGGDGEAPGRAEVDLHFHQLPVGEELRPAGARGRRARAGRDLRPLEAGRREGPRGVPRRLRLRDPAHADDHGRGPAGPARHPLRVHRRRPQGVGGRKRRASLPVHLRAGPRFRLHRRARLPRLGGLQRRLRRRQDHARGLRRGDRARRHLGPRGVPAQGARHPRHEARPRARHLAAGAVPVPDDRRGLRLRHLAHQGRAGLEADALQRGNALPRLRLLPRQPVRDRLAYGGVGAQAGGADGDHPPAQMDLVTPRRLDVWIGVLLFVLGFALCAMVLLGRRDGMALVHDEVAYLFQARTFAEGHLYMPSPPLPEFFEAAHLIVVPRMMAKYFPGHALLLAPFVRFPWVLPLLLLGASTTLIYVAARVSGFGQLASMAGAVAFAGSGMNLQASASYFSQTASTFSAAAGLSFAALLRQTGRARWGTGFGAAAGLALLIRPFDGLALGAAGVAMPPAWNRRTLAPA